MSLVIADAPVVDAACDSESLSLVSAEDILVIHEHSSNIRLAVQQTSEAIQQFLNWMNTKQGSAQWFREVAIVFSNCLRQSLAGKAPRHIRNVERTVWQIIQNPGWIFIDSNTTRNASKNIKIMEELAISKPDSVTEVDEVTESLLLCTACKNYGSLVVCSGDSCLNRYHWKCSGVTDDEVGARNYFCRDCDPNFVADIQSKRCTKCQKQIKDGCLVVCSGASCLNRYHWKCSGVTADEVGEGNYLCQDCDSNFVADIRSKRSVPPKPNKRPPQPSRGRDKKNKGGVGDSSKNGSELPVLDSEHFDADKDSSAVSESVHDPQPLAQAAQPVVDADAADVPHVPPSYRRRRNIDLTALSSSARISVPKSTAALEHFFWTQGTWTMEHCISTLESLARNPSDHREFAEEYEVALTYLQNRCIALARMYANTEFNVLYENATIALKDYKGKEPIQIRAFVEENLRSYGFIITPRMWSKFEILLIMCILLDSSLVYASINQKTGPQRTEDFQNRYPRVLVMLCSGGLFLS